MEMTKIQTPLRAGAQIAAKDAGLSARAMLVTLESRMWTARRLDKKATRKVNDDAGASSDASRVNKTLVARDSLAGVQSAMSAIRDYHYSRTLPWLNDGTRILPVETFREYGERMRELRDTFNAEVSNFIADYPSLREEARIFLGDLFNAEDYPTSATIRAKFGVELRFMPMPDAADWRVSVSESEMAALVREVERDTEKTIALAVEDCARRLTETVGSLAKRLRDRNKAETEGGRLTPIRDALVENVREVADLLPALNITGDARIAKAAQEVKALVSGLDAETIRESRAVREEVADKAERVLADMAASMGGF